MDYVWALLLSTFGGAVLVGLLVQYLHKTVGDPSRLGFQPLHLWIGGTERAIATTLFIWTPKQVPLFVGGWIAAKLAAGWAKAAGEHATNGHFIALIGNAFSFAVAIAAGLWVSPGSLEILNSN